MAIQIVELHHHAVRVGPTQADADRTVAFYRNVLGLSTDEGRPDLNCRRGGRGSGIAIDDGSYLGAT